MNHFKSFLFVSSYLVVSRQARAYDDPSILLENILSEGTNKNIISSMIEESVLKALGNLNTDPLKNEFKNEFKSELKNELKNEFKTEFRTKLKNEVINGLKHEFKNELKNASIKQLKRGLDHSHRFIRGSKCGKEAGRDSEDFTFLACGDIPGTNSIPCGAELARFSRDTVKAIIDAEIGKFVNIPGCWSLLSPDPAIYSCNGDTFPNACPIWLDATCDASCPLLTVDQCYSQIFEPTVDSMVTHGVQLRKICSSCDEEQEFGDVDPGNLGYCSGYGSDATFSGLLAVPYDVNGISPAAGSLKSVLWSRTLISGTCEATSDDPQGYNTLVSLLMGSNGKVVLTPDGLGHGSSYDYFKAYLVKTAYPTASVPLWLKAKRTLEIETACASEVSNDVIIAGYSEGGYGAVAIAEALESYGANILHLLPGAGPYRLGSTQILFVVKSIIDGNFLSLSRSLILEIGQSYSSTYEDAENYGQCQNLLAESWAVDGTTYTAEDSIEVLTSGGGWRELNSLISTPLGLSSLDVWNQDFLLFIREAIETGDTEPCRNATLIQKYKDNDMDLTYLCDAVNSNELQTYLATVSYPYELCHSPSDNLVPFDNTAGFITFETSGDHAGSVFPCLLRAMNFVNSVASGPVSDSCVTTTTSTQKQSKKNRNRRL